MILTESDRLREEVLRLLRVEYGMDQLRTGTHVSSLIYCLSREWYAQHDPLPVTDKEVALFAIGYGLERVLISRDRAEPFEVDGITLSPDMTLLGLTSDLKSTRMAPNTSAGCAVCGEPYRGHSKASQRAVCAKCGHTHEPSSDFCPTQYCACMDFEPSEPHPYEKAPPVAFELPVGWQRQFMAYVEGWRRQVPEGSRPQPFGVVVVHLISAEIKAYEARWTADELSSNWQWLLERKATRERLLANDDPEPYQHRLYEGECAHCSYSLMCGLRASIDQLKERAANA